MVLVCRDLRLFWISPWTASHSGSSLSHTLHYSSLVLCSCFRFPTNRIVFVFGPPSAPEIADLLGPWEASRPTNDISRVALS